MPRRSGKPVSLSRPIRAEGWMCCPPDVVCSVFRAPGTSAACFIVGCVARLRQGLFALQRPSSDSSWSSLAPDSEVSECDGSRNTESNAIRWLAA
jgi:hypothetical protein